jgi:hypothetical protein
MRYRLGAVAKGLAMIATGSQILSVASDVRNRWRQIRHRLTAMEKTTCRTTHGPMKPVPPMMRIRMGFDDLWS